MQTAPRSETVAVPNLPTTMPPALLASGIASRGLMPAATSAASVAMTVSPAPVTSKTSRACGLHMQLALRVEQRHAVFAQRHQQRVQPQVLAQLLRLGRAVHRRSRQAPTTCCSSAGWA